MNKHSLSVQLLAGVFLSLFAAALSFALLFSLGNALLDHTVYGERFSNLMSNRQFRQLQSYIEREKSRRISFPDSMPGAAAEREYILPSTVTVF